MAFQFDVWMAGPALMGLATLFILYKFFANRYVASHGSAEAYALARKAGLNSWVDRFRDIRSALKKKMKEGKKEGKEIRRDEALAKSDKASKGELQEEKASEAANKETEDMMGASSALMAREGRTTEIISAMECIRQLIESYSQKTTYTEGLKDQEMAAVGDLTRKFLSMTSYNEMDSQVTAFLRELPGRLIPMMEGLVSNEEKKEGDAKELVVQLKKTLETLKRIIKEAGTEEWIVRKYQRKENRDFNKEIKDLKKSVTERKKSLAKLGKDNKKADPQLIAKLQEELRMLQDHYGKACNIRNQMKATEGVIKKDISLSKATLKRIRGFDKKMMSFDKALAKTEKKMETRLKELRSSVEKLKGKLGSGAGGSDIYTISISISSSLNEYYSINEKLTLMASEDFNKKIKDMIATGFQLARRVEEYARLGASLDHSEEVVDQGAEVLIKIIESGTDNSKIRAIDEEITRTLEGVKTVLQQAELFEQEMARFITSIAYRINNTNPLIDRILDEEKKILEITKVSSDNINHLVAELFKKKNEIHKKYLEQARAFTEKIGGANASAIRQQKLATSIGK